MKNYSPSVERNKKPIFEVLSHYLTKSGRLLEIGSGSGEHAVFFAEKFPMIDWHCSDLKIEHPSIKSWMDDSNLPNLLGPHPLEVGKDDFPKLKFDHVFTANTFHIMSWKRVKTLIKLLGKRLREDSHVYIYGPYNYGGKFTSESNEKFNQFLKERDSSSGIRNFEDVENSMHQSGFSLVKDHEMPANNRLLVFCRERFR